MSESKQHLQLVKYLTCKAKKIVPHGNQVLIQHDAPDSCSTTPIIEGGYRPDVYYCFNELLIIGEAKTSADVEKQHSRDQYSAYMHECSRFEGESYFLIAVPWTEYRTAYNIVHNLKNKITGSYHVNVYKWIGEEE